MATHLLHSTPLAVLPPSNGCFRLLPPTLVLDDLGSTPIEPIWPSIIGPRLSHLRLDLPALGLPPHPGQIGFALGNLRNFGLEDVIMGDTSVTVRLGHSCRRTALRFLN